MPWRLTSTSNGLDTNTDSFQPSNEEEEENELFELAIGEYDSLLTSFYHLCRDIVANKIRFAFVTMLNIATRLTHLTRQKPVAQSTSAITSSFQEDINRSSTSFINFNSQTDFPSRETSPMARMLVQQRTPNINIHQSTSTNDENLSPTAHSLDDRLIFYKPDSTSLLEILQRFASESHLPKYQTTSNGFVNKKLCHKGEKPPRALNCDTIQPVVKSNVSDDISSTTNTTTDDNLLLNTSATLNLERAFRRRKRRSSLTKFEPIVTDSIEKVDDNSNNTSDLQDDDSPSISIDALSIDALSIDDNGESNNQTTPPSRLRARKFRHRLQQQTPDKPVEFFLPTEISTPVSPPPSPPPISPTTSNPIAGGLKRTNSVGNNKKVVRFADSVGRELAQVQYIQSPINDDDELNELALGKNGLYLPQTSHIEHKPWSFDVALPSKQISDTPVPRRFFCLYRQPNSEHPDIYLHEIWKSQIKLEHADVRLKSPFTGEQSLHGTVWVTNAGYWKNVTVKYSFNRWLNVYEYDAQHRCHSNDFRNIDQFEFNIDIPNDVDRIDFVLRYHVNGQEHWDNNGGQNYTIETDSASTPQTIISLPHDCDFNEMRFY